MTTSSLTEAILALQTDLPKIIKDETAKIDTTKRSYTYKYTNLATITKIVLPIITRLGMIWTTTPTINAAGRFVLSYKLTHINGECVSGEYPLPERGSPQEIGSAITYARRYSLCCVTGIAPNEDDDDAVAATTSHHRPMNDIQRKNMFALFSDLGRDDRDDQLTYLSWITGRTITSRADLTNVEATRVIADLNHRIKETEMVGY